MSSEPPGFVKFEKLRDSGLSPQEVTEAAIEDGFDFVQTLTMLRSVFGLDLIHTKELWVQTKAFAGSLSEYQETLMPEIEEVLKQIEKECK